MSKKTEKAAKQKNIVEMPLVNPYSAGIDVGDTEHVVAIPEGLDKERVKKFGTMTCDLEAIISWLKTCGIVTVAMKVRVYIGSHYSVCWFVMVLKYILLIQNM